MELNASQRTSILVVDDDPDLLRLMQIRLTAAGYAVSTAESGERALVQASVARPQLVVTDLRMGGMDGMALFDAIRADRPTMPVIILTAHGTIPDAVAAVQRGVFGYLTKPFDSKALLTEVERALAMAGGVRANGDAANEWRRDIITRNPAMEDVLAKARMVAESDASVFIQRNLKSGSQASICSNRSRRARAGISTGSPTC